MSCFYCNSFFHSSQNCDIYSTGESRKKYLAENKLLEKCLHSHTSLFSTCYANSKCYICFSKNHRTIFCEQKRSFEPFMQKIDQTLHSRFFQALDSIDKYSMAFLSPKYFHFFKQPKGITVTTKIEEYQIKKYANQDILVIPSLSLYNRLREDLSDLLSTTTLSIKPRRICLQNIQSFPGQYFRFFSPIAENLSCTNVTFDSTVQFEEMFAFGEGIKSLKLENFHFASTVKFSEILSKIPNVEELDLKETNVRIQNSWPDDLMKFDAGRKLKDLSIQLDNINFDFEKLVQFMKSKKKTNLSIHLEIFQTDIATLQEKINTHFVPYDYINYHQPILNIIQNFRFYRYSLA